MMASMGLKRHQILLFKGDWQRLAALYPERPPTETMRNLVRRHIMAMEAKREEAKKLETRRA